MGAPRAAARRAERGLSGAWTRLRNADRQDSFSELTEFLWWVISADDLLSDRRLVKTFRYLSDRNNDPRGQVVAGLRYVRNAVGHTLLTVTQPEGGLTFPASWPITIPPIVAYWMDTADVPPPDRPSPINRTWYDKWVAGRPVSETVDMAGHWLIERLRQLDQHRDP